MKYGFVTSGPARRGRRPSTQVWRLSLLLSFLLPACTAGMPAPLPPAALTVESISTAPIAPVSPTDAPPSLTPTFTASAIPSLTLAPSLTPTPDPYAQFTIEHLAARTYGGSELKIVTTMAVTDDFTRALISYPSDGLTIYGFMNVPHGDGPFPVVIALHGYIDPGLYSTLDYTTHYADSLADAGYLVLHPNLRGYPPSDDGPNLFRVGFAADVLNLIALVRQQGGLPGALQAAKPEALGLWGHSMGGGISIRVMTLSPAVRAVVLYGSMSGDDQKNFDRIYHVFSNRARGLEELSVPAEAFPRISPIFFLDRVTAAVSIHHGEADDGVPLEWSTDLCQRLQALGKPVECFTYPGQPHTFRGEGDQLFKTRVIDFFDGVLK